TAVAVTGLNPLAGDTWAVTYAAANAQNKNVIAVAVTGAAATDIGTSANGSSAAPSAPWAPLLVPLPAAAPAALGNQSAPAGGVQMPPYPVLPNPRTWAAPDMLLTPLLRADPGNALALLANPPLVLAGQTLTGQAIPSATVTTLALDTEITDTWQSHQVPARQVT